MNFQWAIKTLVPKTVSDFLSLAWILSEIKVIQAASPYFYRKPSETAKLQSHEIPSEAQQNTKKTGDQKKL